ncbi:hypothetical protein AVEN_223152-1 [Araneus ventricosus]|uniref:Uncharacterized protein n=1 Tax=Araneus ventricosus TaxID=182803 RepID=A0A4Y2WSM4_ARAVE|nr:hypothetical protein AVEN_223152-1 [Araneus ventricosus]
MRSVWGAPPHTKSYVVAKQAHVAGVVWKLGDGGGKPGVKTSPSDRGSKLRGPSQNNRRIASKWDVNTTKLKLLVHLTYKLLLKL